VIEYHESGKIREIAYFENGELHREHGPARLVFEETGDVSRTIYANRDEIKSEFRSQPMGMEPGEP